MNKTPASEYAVINVTAIQKRIEELEQEYKKELKQPSDVMCVLSKGMIGAYKDVLSQSTPLIPEIEKAFDAGEKYITFIVEDWDDSGEGDQININKKEYISNLKLDI